MRTGYETIEATIHVNTDNVGELRDLFADAPGRDFGLPNVGDVMPCEACVERNPPDPDVDYDVEWVSFEGAFLVCIDVSEYVDEEAIIEDAMEALL